MSEITALKETEIKRPSSLENRFGCQTKENRIK